MEYTIQKLGLLAGVSTRTLRYYDEIEILKPARINSSGYRIYGEEEVNRLQQILFYKELGLPLDQIKEIITSPTFNAAVALHEHREKLLNKREQLDRLIANVDQTIAANEGRITMTDKEKFEGFKQQMVEENEQKYGKEIREKYGDHAVNQSNEKVLNMIQGEHDTATKLAEEIHTILAKALETSDPAGELAQKAADLHKQWLMLYWNEYSKEAHAGLAQMYVDDERFTAYYDKEQPGTAKFLRDAIHIYTGKRN
ncbi:MerR family transcriptional regulator [Fictibacillus nanhaiensis]|uniref:MerR family transcriptional regulator n=1 Tax=Fictibacillus nanhaiensis TaxID=742169 RepID=A0ABS2ZS38_9BACL|nr:MerR family transcriptional regulator [Fictibacillus nanhaiensis]